MPALDDPLSPARKTICSLSHVINPLLTKPVRSRCLDIGLFCVLRVLWTSTLPWSKNTQEIKDLANIQTSCPKKPHIIIDIWCAVHIMTAFSRFSDVSKKV